MTAIIEKPLRGSEAFKMLEEARDSKKHNGFIANVFLGQVMFDRVFPFAQETRLSHPEEFNLWLENLRNFLWEKVDPEKIETTREIPAEVFSELKKMGAFGLKIPKKYGGLGLSYDEYRHVFTVLGSWDSNVAVLLSAHNSIGVIAPLLEYGTDAQKEEYLPQIACGKITGLALTEEGSGSDPSRLETIATRVYKDGVLVGYHLNGKKLWTTNVLIADYVAVVAKIHKNNEDAKKGKLALRTILLMVDTKSHGFSTPTRCEFAGLGGIYNGVSVYKDVFVPVERMIGDERIGFKIAFDALVFGRLSLAAACVGVMKQTLQISRWWAKERIQERNPIGVYELKAEDLVGMAADTLVMDALVTYVCTLADKHEDIRLESAVAKVITSKVLWKVLCDAMRIRGGRGYEKASSLKERGEHGIGLERLWRGSWINTIFEGENDVMMLFLVRECLNEYVKGLLSINDEDSTLSEKAKAILGSAWQFMRHPHVSNHAVDSQHKVFLVSEAQNIKHKLQTILFSHGLKSEKKQVINTELVERAINLFLMALALSYAESNKEKPLALELAHHFCDTKIEEMTGERARMDAGYVRSGSHNRVVELSKRIMEGEAAWLEGGIISLLEKEGVKI